MQLEGKVVAVTGATLSGRFDPKSFPLGDVARKLAPDGFDAAEPSTATPLGTQSEPVPP